MRRALNSDYDITIAVTQILVAGAFAPSYPKVD
jgi:hypothetical protein